MCHMACSFDGAVIITTATRGIYLSDIMWFTCQNNLCFHQYLEVGVFQNDPYESYKNDSISEVIV